MSDVLHDLVIYGGTSAGIMAAVQAVRMGRQAIVIEPTHRIGGMTTCGLSDTDAGNEAAIGGIALEYYRRIGAKYGRDEAVWMFEPKVALEVLQEFVHEHGVTVLYHERLAGVEKRGSQILSLRLESGKIVRGHIFVDASYEGDLLGAAGVSYFVGREANSLHGETQNGVRTETELPGGIDPYRTPGDPSSGLLARVNPDAGAPAGAKDLKLQAYNFRMCLTNDPANRVMVGKPEGYIEEDYEILFRAIDRGQTRRFFKFRALPNQKSDSNNDSGISTDYIGMNHSYVEADYATREEIFHAHVVYQKGLVWTVQNHPRVPEEIRAFYRPWGLPLDEFVESGHWPPQLYIREARRMLGDYTITENVVARTIPVSDGVGLGSYAMDSHHTQYCVGEDGFLRTEGGFYLPLDAPYPISYRALLPRASECENLIVPVCVSATHAAYGSVRMEPVFMILGQSAATAAVLALEHGLPLSEVPYDLLRPRLLADCQTLECEVPNPDEEHIPAVV
jgi:FAD dependent oxidoreductase